MSPLAITPQRQIRAHQTASTITVYQAYNSSIASAAVSAQRLDASPLFKSTRMTWIKPSWCWMCYRSGYAQKDGNQTNILALEMTKEGFDALLSRAVLAQDAGEDKNGRIHEVRVQWDPERGPRLERIGFRTVQIGIPGILIGEWVRDWVVGIRDVTDVAKEMQKAVSADEGLKVAQLVERGIHPKETVYHVSVALGDKLRVSE